jgi:DNA-binding response OmpR family regulator
VLRAEGHTVVEASSAEAGLDVLRAGAEADPVSLIVVGEGPLGRTGARLLQGMSRVDSPRAPAVVLTTSDSYGGEGDVTFGLRKPFQVEELLALVGRFERQRRPD